MRPEGSALREILWDSIRARARTSHMRSVLGALCIIGLGFGCVACGSATNRAGVDAITRANPWERADPSQPGLTARVATTIMAVTRGGPGFVAGGQVGDRAAVWTSSDGAHWQRVAVPGPVGPPRRTVRILDVAAGQSALVAVGFEAFATTTRAAAWISVDGTRWRRVGLGNRVFGGSRYVQMTNVISWRGGFLATGSESTGDETLHIRIWESVDGRSWEAIPSAQAGFASDRDETIFELAAGQGRLVAVGRSDGRATAWTSTDGVNWRRVVQEESVFGPDPEQALYGVTAGGPGFVAVGEAATRAGHEHFVVLLSQDGVEWRQSATSAAGVFVDQSLHHTTATSSLVFAAGGDIGALADAAVWVSRDGDWWVRARAQNAAFDGPGNQVVNALAIGNHAVVAVGADYGRPEPAIWFARLP